MAAKGKVYSASFRFRLIFAFLWVGSIILIAVGLLIEPEFIDPFLNPFLRSALLLIEAAMVGLFGIYLVVYIIRPVVTLSREVKEVVEGKRAKVGHTNADELNDIASSFNHAISRLQEMEDKGTARGIKLPDDAGEPLLEELNQFSMAALFARQPESFMSERNVCELALHRVTALTRAHGGSLLLYNKKGGDHNCCEAAAFGKSPPYPEGFRCYLDDKQAAELRGLYEPLYLGSGAQRPTLFPLFPNTSAPHRLLLPVKYEDELIGLFHLCLENQPPPRGQELKLLNGLLAECGVAITFARVYSKIRDDYRENAKELARLWEHWHPFVRGHSVGVARYARALAEKLALPQEKCEAIECAAYLHDIGELGISDLILHKPGELTEKERQLMQTHPFLSVEILHTLELKREITEVILNHHERWDGGGYPGGSKEKEIPIGARILALADAFQAMCADRPHRRARQREEALEKLKRLAGEQFDPALIEPFIEAAGKVDRGCEWRGHAG